MSESEYERISVDQKDHSNRSVLSVMDQQSPASNSLIRSTALRQVLVGSDKSLFIYRILVGVIMAGRPIGGPLPA